MTLPTLLITTTLLFLPLLVHTAASITAGPSAYVSISDLPEFSTARQCMAYRLWYQGDYPHAYDLTGFLDCGGHYAINGCYCRSDFGSSATGYLSSEIMSGCSSANPSAELSSATSMYNAYCKKVMAESQDSAPSAAKTNPASIKATTTTAASEKTTTAGTASRTGSQAETSASSATAGAADDNFAASKGGLSKSDVIALGVGLGVGVPSLLLALASYFQLRRGREKRQNTFIELR